MLKMRQCMQYSAIAAVLVFSWLGDVRAQSTTLTAIQDRGLLRCGVINSGVGLSEIDENGIWQGFFPDYCRFVAAAVLGDVNAVDYVEVNYVTRFDALNSDAFDVLMATSTWTAGRDVEQKLAFTHPLFYDGQGFMAHRTVNVGNLDDLVGRDGLTICVNEGTTTIGNLRDMIQLRGLQLELVPFQSVEGVYDAFFTRVCDLMTQDRVALVSQRLNRAADAESFILLPETISKEPLGPVVRQDDPIWFDIVQWVVFASLIAEEKGISRDNIENFKDSDIPEIRRLLGLEPNIGAALGLADSWAYDGLRLVGSYKDIFDRTLGVDSAMLLERGLNASWTDGGLMYAPPLR